MRKQTKLVAVLSAAALLAVGASMTSFAGWEKDEDGIWHYYDSDDQMVEGEWRKDGSKWFYLDEDGNMATDTWVDDDYYVGEDGAMVKNDWRKTFGEDEEDDPDQDEHWYYFGSNGKKVTDQDKKINGKTYYFDEDGKMYSGWYSDGKDDVAYYLGTEDEGWRAENQWLWLENSGDTDDDFEDDDTKGESVLGCDADNDDDPCDDEGWYWFGSDGKAYHGEGKKKINGRYYMFNEHGQMLYEWINDNDVRYPAPGTSSNAQLDGNLAEATSGNALGYAGAAQNIQGMLYYNVVEEGWRGDGWYEIDGSEDAGTDGDTDWYYIDDGEPERADAGFDNPTKNDYATHDDDGAVYVARIKVPSQKMGKVYFAFNEMGQMQTGLQYIPEEKGFYYFDDLGYPVDGKVSDVECDDDSYAFRFETKNGHNGKGIQGEKDNYLYFNGKRLEADDDYKFYVVDSDVYLVNNKGKIQKSKGGKTYDEIENGYFEGKNVKVTTNNNGVVTKVEILDDDKKTVEENIKPDELVMRQVWAVAGSATEEAVALNKLQDKLKAEEGEYGDEYVAVPFIQLYDDDVYTSFYTIKADGSEFKLEDNGETWVGMNK
ncbi:MAG: glucan-binding protein [Clostridium sp.]